MSKLPAFQFYPGDWRKDMGVQSLSFHDRGVWWEMLCLMHESERRGVLILNGKAMDHDCLSRLLGLDKQILTTTLTSLLTSGVASIEQDTGAIYSRRMVRDENLRKIRAEAGSKGGNPVLVKQKPTTPVKQIPTPSSSVSTSVKDNKPPTFVLPEWVPQDLWEAWMPVRKAKKAANTTHALEIAVRQLARLKLEGFNPVDVLEQSILRGYSGLFPVRDKQPEKKHNPLEGMIFANGRAQ